MLQRMPRQLKEQPLLRIEAPRFSGGDPEEVGVECLEVADEPATGRGDRSDTCVPIGAIDGRVPAVGGYVADRVRLAHHQPP